MKNITYIQNIKDSPHRQIFSSPTCVDLGLGQYLCPDRICEQCGNDHDFDSSFDDVKTSIDIIPELCQKLKIWESRDPL